jgi:hypothetical protein
MKMLVPEKKGPYLKILIVFLAIVMVFCFWLSVRNSAEPVSITVMPLAPRQGEPEIATYKLNNPSSEPLVTGFKFYANGNLLRDGQVTLAPGASQTFELVYNNNLPNGQQLNFMLKTQSAEGNYDKLVSVPPIAPQVLIGFISFATFSTSIMSSMSSMVYYQNSFGISNMGVNIGLIMVFILIALLIFMELSGTRIQGKSLALGQLRIRFSSVTWILLIIFLGMVYTRVVLILTG